MNGKMSRLSKSNRITLFLLALSLYALSGQQVHALCAEQPEAGDWVNADTDTRSLTRAELRFTCQDQILNGEPYPPGPPWHIHLWGACSPSDCNWGEVGAETVTIDDRTYIRAVYHQEFATRYVYADMSRHRNGQLWIWMWTDFVDPNRPDYESQNWFIQEHSAFPTHHKNSPNTMLSDRLDKREADSKPFVLHESKPK